MSTYHIAVQKLSHPIDLKPDDIAALRVRDPWLATAAVKSWQSAIWWKEYRKKYPPPAARPSLPVVKIYRSR